MNSLLPTWMRAALFATAGMNIAVAAAFLPPAAPIRVLAGLPEGAPLFYLLTVAMFVLIFGLGYLWMAAAGRAERFFIALSAGGKLFFVALVVSLWTVGDLPGRAPLLAAADVVFAMLFLLWLVTTPAH